MSNTKTPTTKTQSEPCQEWEWTSEQIERRNARDRILAREVGIEIGRRREAVKNEKQSAKSFTRGLFIGIAIVNGALNRPVTRA